MSLKKLSLITVATLALSVPLSSQAGMKINTLLEVDKTGSSNICQSSLGAICDDTKNERAAKDERVKELKAEIAKVASANAAPRLAEAKRTIPKWRLIKRFKAKIRIQNQEIMKAAQERIADLETAVNQDNVARVKEYMYQAIDTSKYDATTKTNFKQTIKSIVVGNFHDFIERTNLDDNVLMQFMNNPCGSDGLVENAFATTLGSDKYVLICPGFLVTLSETPTAAQRFNTILQAISHEMGHHIDNSKVGDELYNPYLNCIADNYADQFKRTKKDQEACKKDAAGCNKKVTLSHAGELVADAWGIKVLNLHMRNNSFSFEQADELLTQSWANLCGSGDEGIHPTGDFRIGTILRKDPGISSYLACDNTQLENQKPACTIDGTVAL